MAAIGWVARRLGAGVLAGVVGGAAAGAAARLMMFVIRLSNGAYDGATTHEGWVNGQWTLWGTLGLVLQGVSIGLVGGFAYLLVRPLLLGPPIAKGLEFGTIALVFLGSLVLDGNYEYSRYVDTRIAVLAFAALYPLYGAVVALVADANARPGPRRFPRLASAGSVALALVTAYGATTFVRELRFRYFP